MRALPAGPELPVARRRTAARRPAAAASGAGVRGRRRPCHLSGRSASLGLTRVVTLRTPTSARRTEDSVTAPSASPTVAVGDERTAGVPGAHPHDVRAVRRRVAATSTRCTTTTRSRPRSGTRRCSATACSRWALAARVVKDWFGPEAIRRFQVRFSKQVWPGDMLTCTAVGHRQARGGRRASSSTSTSPSRTRTATRRSPARPPRPSS